MEALAAFDNRPPPTPAPGSGRVTGPAGGPPDWFVVVAVLVGALIGVMLAALLAGLLGLLLGTPKGGAPWNRETFQENACGALLGVPNENARLRPAAPLVRPIEPSRPGVAPRHAYCHPSSEVG